MNIIGVQLILCFFALFMMYVLFLHWKKKEVSDKFFIVWTILWIIFILFTFFPKILEPLLIDLFIIRVMDLGMIATFMILTYVSVENNIKIRKLEDQIEKLVRKISINSFKKNNK